MNQNKLTKRELLGWSMLACVPLGILIAMIDSFGFVDGFLSFGACVFAVAFIYKGINLTEGG